MNTVDQQKNHRKTTDGERGCCALAFSDEAIVTAVLTYRTNREAAKALKITERHLYTRLQDKGLQAKLRAAREQAMQEAMLRMQSGLTTAANALLDIIESPETNPQTRVSAANVLFQNCLKVTETVDIIKRLEALEDAN